MKQKNYRKLLLLPVLLFVSICYGQSKYTLSGYIKDAATAEDLIGANVYVSEIKTGVSSNLYGFYSITLAEGIYQISFTYLGYEIQKKEVNLNSDISLDVLLEPIGVGIEEVVISATKLKAKENVERAVVGIVDIDARQIKEIPVIGGEKDILKSIQLLPGVQSGSEGTAGFYVRGGGPDQNLILLDEAVVYNPYHLLGFFSIFNVDAIKNVELIKGGFPAKYGGRLSSILNISMKEGNKKTFHGEGGIGFISSRLTLEGPIVKDKASFLVSGRRTYLDQVVKAITPKELRTDLPQLYFYDLNTKINFQLGEKDRIYLSGYFGNDIAKAKFDESEEIRVPWGNNTLTLRWNHIFNNKLFANFSAIYNDYDFQIDFKQFISNDSLEFNVRTGINDYNTKLDFDYYPDINHKIQFGFHYANHKFNPSTTKTTISGQLDTTVNNVADIRKVNDVALYFSDEFKINEQLQINAGLRLPAFFYRDSTKYFNIEPRFIFNYRMNRKHSLKGSYTLMNQYAHLVTNSTLSFPWDVWLPSSDIIKPKQAHQVSLGYFTNFHDDKYEASTEVYYKTMSNLIEFKEGADIFIGDGKIEDQITFGEGWSYGAEFFIKKRSGRLNGWLGYTLSWTNRKFDELNFGKTFPAKYDRRHDLSIVATYDFNKMWQFTAAFVYGSGQSITLPKTRYVGFSVPVNEIEALPSSLVQLNDYSERNGFKLRSYNRLDIGIRRTKEIFNGKAESIFRFDVYNAYGRRNPYFVYLDLDNYDELSNAVKPVAKQFSLFGTVPSISWNFKF